MKLICESIPGEDVVRAICCGILRADRGAGQNKAGEITTVLYELVNRIQKTEYGLGPGKRVILVV